jgi:hypothetical protein
VDTAIGAFLLCLALSVMSLRLLDLRGRSRPTSLGLGSPSRSWTSPLSAIQAGTALVTVSQRLGYSVDRDVRPGFTVLGDRVMAGSYGQLFPVSLTTTGGGTLVRVGISAKDPACALTEAVQQRRLEDFARRMRAIFVAAEEDTTAEGGAGA